MVRRTYLFRRHPSDEEVSIGGVYFGIPVYVTHNCVVGLHAEDFVKFLSGDVCDTELRCDEHASASGGAGFGAFDERGGRRRSGRRDRLGDGIAEFFYDLRDEFSGETLSLVL